LRGDSEDVHVHGHHTNLYQVELPQWLPLDVVVDITAEFKKILLRQIRIMQCHSKHTSCHSVDSLGGISPDLSEHADDTDTFQRFNDIYDFHIPISNDLQWVNQPNHPSMP